MKRGILLVLFSVIALFLFLSTPIVSAGWLSDLWDKISGSPQLSPSQEVDNAMYISDVEGTDFSKTGVSMHIYFVYNNESTLRAGYTNTFTGKYVDENSISSPEIMRISFHSTSDEKIESQKINIETDKGNINVAIPNLDLKCKKVFYVDKNGTTYWKYKDKNKCPLDLNSYYSLEEAFSQENIAAENYGGWSENTTCTDTCNSLSYECGTWTICGSEKNCGNCSTGEICEDGKCIKETNVTCNDSDGGKNYYEKGALKYDGFKGNDYCVKKSWNGSEYPLTGEVVEFYCLEKPDAQGNMHSSIKYKCPNGCEDGKCIKETNVTCNDSDGGINIYRKGNNERCLEVPYGKIVLEEYYCPEGAKEPHILQIDCSMGCQNGACIGEEKKLPDCVDSDGKNYYRKGITKGPKYTGKEKDLVNAKEYQDECHIKGEINLLEYRCKDGLVVAEGYSCPNGCEDGACIPKNASEEVCQKLISNPILTKKVGSYILEKSITYHSKYPDFGPATITELKYDSDEIPGEIFVEIVVLDNEERKIKDTEWLKEVKEDSLWGGKNIWADGEEQWYYMMKYDEAYSIWYNKNVLVLIVESGGQEEEKINEIQEFVDKIKDNEFGYVNKYESSWEFHDLIQRYIRTCPSTVYEPCWPYWEYKIEPVICPPHGEQTEIWRDANKCTEKIEERTILCSPGICAGCYVARWSGVRDNICIPYGTRLMFEENDVLQAYETEMNRETEEFKVTINNDYTALIKVVQNITEDDVTLEVDGEVYDITVGESKVIYEGRDYDITIRDGIYEKTVSIRIKDIVYSEDPNKRYIEAVFIDNYPAYCNYDGRIKQQKTKDYRGNWASCQNNFECESNFCSSGECIGISNMISQAGEFKSLGARIVCRLAQLFGIKDYNDCVVGFLGTDYVAAKAGGGGGGGASNTGPPMP